MVKYFGLSSGGNLKNWFTADIVPQALHGRWSGKIRTPSPLLLLPWSFKSMVGIDSRAETFGRCGL